MSVYSDFRQSKARTKVVVIGLSRYALSSTGQILSTSMFMDFAHWIKLYRILARACWIHRSIRGLKTRYH